MTYDPDRRWSYVEPGADGAPTTITMTEAEILAVYFLYWADRMRRVGKADEITPEGCIDDWVVVNWASEVHE